MAEQLLITNIDGKSDDWRVKTLVAQKSNVHTTEKEKRLQKLLLLDQQGNKVEGVLWDNNIDILKDSLNPFSTYIIGGARVQPVKPGFPHSTPGITTQWIMSRDTFIQPVTQEDQKIPYLPLQLTPFAIIPSLANGAAIIDIVATVTAVQEPRLVEARGKLMPIRECTVVQQELKPMMLTL